MKTFSKITFAAFLLASLFAPRLLLAADVVPAVSATPTGQEWAALKIELEQMLETDQKHRALIFKAEGAARDALWKKQLPIDEKNQQRVDEIIAKFGWPGATNVGRKGALAVFLVIQHAPLPVMKRHYAAMNAEMKNGEMQKENFALIEDRIRMYEERPQLYGSQIKNDPETGKRIIWKIEDEANVDKRRAEMGLPPLIEYAKFFGIDYVPVKLTDNEPKK